MSKCPVVGDDVNQSERHGEGTEEDVRDSKVDDESIPCSQKNLISGESQPNTSIAKKSRNDDEAVDHYENGGWGGVQPVITF